LGGGFTNRPRKLVNFSRRMHNTRLVKDSFMRSCFYTKSQLI
jgi:hypothetical protein